MSEDKMPEDKMPTKGETVAELSLEGISELAAELGLPAGASLAELLRAVMASAAVPTGTLGQSTVEVHHLSDELRHLIRKGRVRG